MQKIEDLRITKESGPKISCRLRAEVFVMWKWKGLFTLVGVLFQLKNENTKAEDWHRGQGVNHVALYFLLLFGAWKETVNLGTQSRPYECTNHLDDDDINIFSFIFL